MLIQFTSMCLRGADGAAARAAERGGAGGVPGKERRCGGGPRPADLGLERHPAPGVNAVQEGTFRVNHCGVDNTSLCNQTLFCIIPYFSSYY